MTTVATYQGLKSVSFFKALKALQSLWTNC